MLRSLEIIHLCRKVSAVTLSRGICTDSILLANVKRRGIPKRIPDEPGIRRRRALFQDEGEDTIEEMKNEGDLEDEVDIMNIDRAYDLNKRERFRNKRKLEYIITAKKFFAPRAQPPMLTYNERQCIKYLHKEDPVQWSIKTLSESFPATPGTIKKIIKMKWKITPERAKALDEKVQKNWELLAEGKLDAAPEVLEHCKRFINRREVLLEQLKNDKFYLPEVKKERDWDGVFSGILRKYEKDVAGLAKATELEQEPKMLKDGLEKNDREEEKSSLDLIRAKINTEVSRHSEEKKDSFLFREMTKFYSKHTTLEDLEDRILKRADERKNLDIVDKAILEERFGVKSEKNVENSSETLTPSEKIQKNMEESLQMENKHFMRSNENAKFITGGNGMRLREEEMDDMEFKSKGRSRRFNSIRPEEEEMDDMEFKSKGRSRRFNSIRPEEEEMDDMEFKSKGRSRRFNSIGPEEEEMDDMEFKSKGRSRRFNRIRSEEEEMDDMEFSSGRRRRFNRVRSEEVELEKIDGNRRFNGVRLGQEETDLNIEFVPPDERTLISSENNIGEVLEMLQNKPQPKNEATVESKKIVQEKPKIDFSDPERLKRENIYYDKEVKDIENTAFWNKGRSSEEKALAEQNKRPHDGPEWAANIPDVNRANSAILSQDPYPEKIKIPKNKQRSGLIFKVKDCYYDDDGEFLYRVPGMTK